ncbi:MAG: DUF2283 domain-containing protein [Actinomycetota bacterium]
MALYTYDEEADALYVLLALEPEAAIDRTLELGERLHVDLGADGLPIGVEILYPKLGGVDLKPLRDRFGIELKLPFRFAA